MKEEVENRFDELIAQGEELVRRLPRDEYGIEDDIPLDEAPPYHSWLLSAANLVSSLVPAAHQFAKQCTAIIGPKEHGILVRSHDVVHMHGVLKSARQEWDKGFLRKLEYIVVAETFDNFLDHATLYHKGNKKVEASVLASAVFEDSVRKIGAKNGITTTGMAIEAIVDDLVKAGVFTPVKAKRVKGWAAVRNHSLHADWEKFDIRDVGELIGGTRELVDTYLQ